MTYLQYMGVSLGFLMALMSTHPALCCESEYNKWQDWMRKAEGWGRASEATAKGGMVGGSFLGPAGGLLGLAGAGPGAVSYRYHRMAQGAEKGYRECLERIQHEREQQYREAQEAARRQEELAQRARDEEAQRTEEAIRRAEEALAAEQACLHCDNEGKIQDYDTMAIED